ncbi:MAG: ABC transporter, partial [Planctomycetes bacterium]|nr:ABC transporter [Planctomycetota bacterium]
MHSYPSPGAWEAFLTDLESLPAEFAVIGINDYIFLDGYKKLLEARNQGRLSNIDLILPVVELRIDKFGGSDSHLSRVNFHVIFSDELSPEFIEQQFISALAASYQISPMYKDAVERARWEMVPTRASLEKLGELIIASVPEERKRQFGAPLIEGFNNLCFEYRALSALLDKPHFQGKVLTAVGKTEWADIEWNDHSIAEKKNLINAAQFVFVAAETPAAWERARRALDTGGVNSQLLDCSDAHALSNATTKDRIGNCFTWIIADPTFDGLRHLLHSYEDRAFVGEFPPAVLRSRNRPTRVLSEVTITKTADGREPAPWFDAHIVLNPELIAIIGNKGSGKSALADILGLLGNTPRFEAFSFLNTDKFRSPKGNKAQSFEACIEWKDSTKSGPKCLADNPEPGAPETIRYLPQHYLETVCNELTHGSDGQFYAELKHVIFSHVPQAEQLGYRTLDQLLDHKSEEIRSTIAMLAADMHRINAELVECDRQLAEENRQRVRLALEEKRRELKAHDDAKPPEPETLGASGQAPTSEAAGAASKPQLEIDAARAECHRSIQNQPLRNDSKPATRSTRDLTRRSSFVQEPCPSAGSS